MKTRTKFVIGALVILAVMTVISVRGLKEMVVFFYTPSEVLAEPVKFQEQKIRIGALVSPGTVDWNADTIQLKFRITEDGQDFISVVYQGVKPDMFREGRGVVVEGQMRGEQFYADLLLVKHSEEYTVEQTHRKKKEDYYQSILNQ